MSQGSQYGVLFEPATIGPVTAKNRFYQVPHCCGLGHVRPQAHAAMRAIKAEGGWAVVSTEETEIHPSSDLAPYAEQRLWDERDIPALRLMTDAVHVHGALAAIELAHNGHHAPNHLTRTPPLAPVDMAIANCYPKQARAMSKSDIKDLRRWHRAAARRARDAGFDIVYIYAGHQLTLPQHFLSSQINNRSDEYGGNLENRVRLIRELLEETKEEIGENCAVAFRFAVDELKGGDGLQAHEEGRAVVELLADIPDLWDVNVSDWSNDSMTTRFEIEDGYEIPYIQFVKEVTKKPVVATGRLSSPDLMVSLVSRNIVDFIGAARPSIADPFLPIKIRDNRIDEIRECIGCNICVSCDTLGVPIRCTQNPTMGEEWRRGWHPEFIEAKVSDAAALVLGAGPAGLECAMQLGRRGYQVTLAEATTELGGRALREPRLKGLGAWQRVRDNRIYELQQSANVEIFLDSPLSAQQVVELGIDDVFIATGARWRRDGVGRSNRRAISNLEAGRVFTPDDIFDDAPLPDGPVVVYDDDQCYLAGVIADHLCAAGHQVTFITPASEVSPWTVNTLEQWRVQRSLIKQGVEIRTNEMVTSLVGNVIETSCIYSHGRNEIPCEAVVLVTERVPNRTLYNKLVEFGKDSALPALDVRLIGDALAPGLIADAVYSGHMAARDFERDPEAIEASLHRREITSLS